MDLALFENTMTIIGLGQRNKSKSPLKLLSSDTLKNVLAYAGIKPKGKKIKRIAKGRGEDLALRPFVGYTGTHFKSLKHKDETRLNLADMNVLQPGSKLTIPLTKPNLHLTGPCYRGKKFCLCLLFRVSNFNCIKVCHSLISFRFNFFRSTQVCKGSGELGCQTYRGNGRREETIS